MSENLLPLVLDPKTGTVFKSEAAAKDAMRKKGFDPDSCILYPHLGGWAILDVSRLHADFFHLAAGGKPFRSLEEAQSYRAARSLSENRARPVRWNGGWALLSMDAVANPQTAVETPVPKERPAMTYSLVEFDERYPGSPEPELVVLSLLNLDLTLQIQRGVQVVVPDPMLEIADNATYRKMTHREHEGRKVGAKVRRTGYRRIRAATEAEFKLFVQQGQKALEEYLKAEVAQPQAVAEV